jgi:hypothetical protein
VLGFEGDTSDHLGLPDWYEPHIAAWSDYAAPSSTLWFWNSEIGWAVVHADLKSVAPVAGNGSSAAIVEKASAQRRTSPKFAPARVAVVTVPGPMKAAATIQPGPPWKRLSLTLSSDCIGDLLCSGGSARDHHVAMQRLCIVRLDGTGRPM